MTIVVPETAGALQSGADVADSDCSKAVAQIVTFFETLTPMSVAQVAQLYAPDARFKDPFSDVRGTTAISHIFAHMFSALDQPRFAVTGQVVQGAQSFLTWEFRFGFKSFKVGQPQVIFGASHLVFSEHGQVTLHRDYWDAAEELYEKLPGIGGLMRWLKKRANS